MHMPSLNLLWIQVVMLPNIQQVTWRTQGEIVLESGTISTNTTLSRLHTDVLRRLHETNSSTISSYLADDYGRNKTTGDFEVSCPSPCICIAGTIAHCSRQEITALSTFTATLIDNRSLSILSGPFPPTISIVHLGYNNITFLPENMLRSEENDIRKVYLQNNMIRKVHPDSFLYLDKLELLDLSRNFITNFMQSCALNKNRAGTLNRTRNFVNYTIDSPKETKGRRTHCPPGVRVASFIPSLSRSIKTLSLHHNLIRNIPNHSFTCLKNLEVLSLNWNQISWIGRRAFVGLHSLKVLQLRANPFTVKTSAKMGEILQHFSIAEVPPQTETDGRKTIVLELSQLFQSSKDLNTKADVAHGSYGREITIMRRKLRKKRRNRRRKRIRKRRSILEGRATLELNALESLDLGETNLNILPTHLPKSLVRLYLDNNAIRELHPSRLKQLKKLKILQLGGNRIENIPDMVFSQLNHLSVLDLSRNDLTRLNVNSFYGLLEASSLRLNGNQRLRELPRKVFYSTPSLKLLYMQDCNIKKLPPGPWIYRILALWLYGNPIDCDCQGVLTLIMRQQHPRASQALQLDPYRALVWDDADTWKYQRPTKTICDSPSQFSGYPVQEVRIRDMRCTTQDWYDTTIHRNIADMHFNPDYQQDDSFTSENQTSNETFENYFTSSEDELITKLYDSYKDELTSKDYKAIMEGSYGNYSQFFAVTEGEVDLQGEENNTSRDDDDLRAQFDVEDSLYEKTGDLLDKALEFSGMPDQLEENLKPAENSEKLVDKEPCAEEGREWVIELPAGAEVEYPYAQPESKEATQTLNLKIQLKTTETDPTINNRQLSSEITEDESLTDTTKLEDSNFGIYDTDLDYGLLQEGKHEIASEREQGYAPYIYYDNGEANMDSKRALSFDEQVLRGMDPKQEIEFKRRVEQTSLWEAYNEYYNDEVFSGDISSFIDDFYDGNEGTDERGGVLKSAFAEGVMNIDDELYYNTSKENGKDEHGYDDELIYEGST